MAAAEHIALEPAAPYEVIRVNLDARFELGGHKAAAIGMVLENAQIDLISEMDPAFVKSIFFTPRNNVQEALDAAFTKYGPNASVIAMPFGGATLPILETEVIQ